MFFRKTWLVAALSLALASYGCPSESDDENSGGDRAPGEAVSDAGIGAKDGGPKEVETRDASAPDVAAAASTKDAATQVAAATDSGSQAADAGDTGVSDGGSAANGGVACTDNIAPTSEAVAVVLARSCGLSKSCHAGDNAQKGLDLSSLDALFATAVGKASQQAPDTLRVAPSDPAKSYLLRKILGMQTEGTTMPPPPSAALCEAKVKAVEAWIRAGAPR